MNPKTLRVLMVEDYEDDAQLLLRELARADYEVTCRRVETEAELREALEKQSWDVIVSDFTLPAFNGLDALEVLQTLRIDTPFIFVSGTLGEDRAVEAMRLGAKDYIVKGNLRRLVPAIERELREAESRRQRALAEAEMKKLEEQLRQAQKMEAIGRLAGGISHDFNNLLTAIIGYTEMLRDNLSNDDPRRAHSEEVLKAAERAASLTRQLLVFSRKQVLDLQVLNLNNVVSELEKLLRRVIGEDIDLKTALEPSLRPIKVDPSQIEQVIMNLVVNARDAMPSGGELTIETANVDLREGAFGDGNPPAGGPYLRLSVSDSGIGMDEKTKARVFEPFFTTKEEGTGLGLATVYGIVKQSAGHIEIHSGVGQGTTFRIYIPQVSESEMKAPARQNTDPSLNGTETILFVEDESGVRKLVLQVLQLKGYAVLEAANAEEALEIARKHALPIDLLLTDVMLPKISGQELADRLLSLDPFIKVLYMSGYPDELLRHRGVLGPGTTFLRKPMSAGILTRKIREVLDQPVDFAWDQKRGMKILILEDDEQERELVSRFLEAKGLVVFPATNKDEAMEVANRDNPQVALLDIMLPGPSGLDVLEQIKRQHPDIRVIMASSVEYEAVGENALRMGAAAYLSKPFRLEHLERLIWRQLTFSDRSPNF